MQDVHQMASGNGSPKMAELRLREYVLNSEEAFNEIMSRIFATALLAQPESADALLESLKGIQRARCLMFDSTA